VAVTERAEWWSEIVSSIHARMAIRVPDDYRGRIEHQHTGAYQLVRWWGDEEFIKRTGRQVQQDPHLAYELLVPVTGSMTVRQAHTTVTLEPGNAPITRRRPIPSIPMYCPVGQTPSL
jgi:hypothetical protein